MPCLTQRGNENETLSHLYLERYGFLAVPLGKAFLKDMSLLLSQQAYYSTIVLGVQQLAYERAGVQETRARIPSSTLPTCHVFSVLRSAFSC